MQNTSSWWAALLMLGMFGHWNSVIHSISSNVYLYVGVQSCCVQQEGWLGRRRGKHNLFVLLVSFHKWLTLPGWGLLFVEQWLLEKCRGSQFSPCLTAVHGKCIILIYFCQGLGMSILPRLNLLFILVFMFLSLLNDSALPVVPLFPASLASKDTAWQSPDPRSW